MPKIARSRLACGLVLAGLMAGCGGDDGFGQRYPVAGTVKLDGEPLKTGTIVFAPLQSGPTAQATIADGAYSISRSQGPGPGPYRVEINSVQSTGKKVLDPGENEMIEQTKNVVPAEYNVSSKLEFEVKPGDTNTFDADLKTSPPTKGAR